MKQLLENWRQYVDEVNEGVGSFMPGSSEWKMNKAVREIQKELADPKHKTTWEKVILELKETKEAWSMIVKWSAGENLNTFEKEFLWEQIKDVAKGTALAVILAAPLGATFWLPFVLRMLDKIGVQALPGAFNENWENFLANNKQ